MHPTVWRGEDVLKFLQVSLTWIHWSLGGKSDSKVQSPPNFTWYKFKQARAENDAWKHIAQEMNSSYVPVCWQQEKSGLNPNTPGSYTLMRDKRQPKPQEANLIKDLSEIGQTNCQMTSPPQTETLRGHRTWTKVKFWCRLSAGVLRPLIREWLVPSSPA